jgi:hypothetical protein
MLRYNPTFLLFFVTPVPCRSKQAIFSKSISFGILEDYHKDEDLNEGAKDFELMKELEVSNAPFCARLNNLWLDFGRVYQESAADQRTGTNDCQSVAQVGVVGGSIPLGASPKLVCLEWSYPNVFRAMLAIRATTDSGPRRGPNAAAQNCLFAALRHG